MAATQLWLVRHGESVGNVAASQAAAAGTDVIRIGLRDADVELTSTGQAQAAALGAWLATLPAEAAPQAVWSSPYRRAVQTAEIAVAQGGARPNIRIDERLRDRELGVLDLLTTVGVHNLFPAEAQRRAWLGKFYYRPPGGESWADMALRVRSLLLDLERTDVPPRVLVVCHDAMILIFRYVCEGMREADLLACASSGSIRNASVTRLRRVEGQPWWSPEEVNADGHLAALGVPVTEHPGDRDAFPH
ncbi:histidine phosphatase family protein [Nakamurella sp.]|uniref:histidine phosphatase family protein n=1 Tax=Nakamurella sp. TaxID=1869182 RepID=UPI003B3A7415